MAHKLRMLGGVLLPLAFIITTGCNQSNSGSDTGAKPTDQLAPPEQTGILEVATRNGATTYYLDRNENPIGPEYSLVSQFAASKGWTVNWTQYDSTAAVLKALESGNTHMAAAGLTHLPSRTKKFTRGPAHTEIIEQLVCHRERRPMPRKPDSIANVGISVTADSSYVETLNKLASEHEGITFSEDSSKTTEVLLSDVARQDIDCTVADSNIVQVMRRHFPHLEVAMNLTQGSNIGRGHLLDARQLARELGKNPDSWDDMKKVLPLKADKRYYPSTRYGYARGYEPVHYVQRIRNYRDVIRTAFE